MTEKHQPKQIKGIDKKVVGKSKSTEPMREETWSEKMVKNQLDLPLEFIR